jgi:hypothetical protein
MSFFRLVFPLVGMPLSAGIPDPNKKPAVRGTDLPIFDKDGYSPHLGEAPTRPSFFNSSKWPLE